MEENNITIEQIKNWIKMLKLEILEKEQKIEELNQILNPDEENLDEED